MTGADWKHACRMADEGEVVAEIEVSDEELASITTHEVLNTFSRGGNGQ